MDVNLIIGLCIVAVIVVVLISWFVSRVIYKKQEKIVLETSMLCKNLSNLNKKYTFDNTIRTKYGYYPTYKSRRGLEKLHIPSYLLYMISEDPIYFEYLFKKAKYNSEAWSEYQKEYKSIAKYTTDEEIKAINQKIKPTTYRKHETKLYTRGKLTEPVLQISVFVHATYTSPAGRKHYWRDQLFTHDEVYRSLQYVKEQKVLEQRVMEEKIARKNATVARAQRMRERERELNVKEKKLQNIEQRERELVSKEQEFIKATQGHIYSATEMDETDDDFENLTPYEQLKRLKQLLADGEITYEEYCKRRKEISEGQS